MKTQINYQIQATICLVSHAHEQLNKGLFESDNLVMLFIFNVAFNI